MKCLRWIFSTITCCIFVSNAQSQSFTAEQDLPLVRSSAAGQSNAKAACGRGAKADKPALKTQISPSSEKINQDVIGRAFAIARLETNGVTAGLRRTFMTPFTLNKRIPDYYANWKQKIERSGIIHYPREAKEQKIYGDLIATVEICIDGSVLRVQIDRSSGHDILDKSFKKIVMYAQPFEPLPIEINEKYDVLVLTARWSFMSTSNPFSLESLPDDQ